MRLLRTYSCLARVRTSAAARCDVTPQLAAPAARDAAAAAGLCRLCAAPLPGCPRQPAPQTCRLHTSPVARGPIFSPGGAVMNVLNKLGVLNISRARLKTSAYKLYAGTVDTIDYAQFFELCDLPDTFYSWYVVTELHVWMLCVRVSDDGAEGRFCRNQLLTAMWEDLETRAKKLGPMVASLRNQQIQLTSDHFKAALVGYDEGLAEDRVLAGALWRRMLSRRGEDAAPLETLLEYVRRQLARLDRLSRDALLMHGENVWEPLPARQR